MVATCGALALAGCSAVGSGPGTNTATGADEPLALLTHDSFALPDGLLEDFEAQSGRAVEVVQAGDGGALANQLVLTQDSPLGDVVYGIDNSFASRAVDAGVLAPYRSDAPAAADAAAYAVDEAGSLTAINVGDVCVNADLTWFADRGIEVPTSLEDLAEPEYRDLLVVSNAATSSPGLAFLLATVGAFGQDGWADYWRSLTENGVQVADGWSDAYGVDFSGGPGAGDRPLVLSYSSSPPFTVPEGGSEPTTTALLDTCFRQVEYAGVIAGTDDEAGARALVDFLLSDEVQVELPTSMFVYPVSSRVELPEDWAAWAPSAPDPFDVPAAEIDANRESWISTWTDVVTQ